MNAFEMLMAWFFANLSVIASIVGIFAPLLTLVGIVIAFAAYKHERSMTDPWSLTKIDADLWLLKRNIPKLATIYRIRSGDGFHKNNLEFDLIPAGSSPGKYFRKGTDILIRIDSSKHLGMVFELHYEEPRREKSPERFHYYENMIKVDKKTNPRGPKVWKTTIY